MPLGRFWNEFIAVDTEQNIGETAIRFGCLLLLMNDKK
jgi:hypothetical protein